MVDGDDDDLRALQAFSTLRLHIVKVSSDFGTRLAVRLMALAAASEQSDPTVAEIFGRTIVDATDIMLSPFEASRDKQEEVPSSDAQNQNLGEETDE